MKRTFLFTTLTCLTLFFSLISFSPPTETNLIDDVLNQTNKFRRSKGLPALVINEDLNIEYAFFSIGCFTARYFYDKCKRIALI